MKLGEIKLEALYLSFPNPELVTDTTDSEALNATLRELRSDPNYSDFLHAAVGAVNRALSALEIRGLTPLLSRELFSVTDRDTGCCILELSTLPKLFSVEGVFSLRNGAYTPVPFELMGEGKLCLPLSNPGETYLIKYRMRLDRISHLTSEDHELPLPEALASLIPYYVKSDILAADEPYEAERALAAFDSMCQGYPKDTGASSGQVYSIYETEG